MYENQVEDVAKAIYADVNKAHATQSGWDEVKPRWQESYRSNARAALAATSAFGIPHAPIATEEELEALPLGSVVKAHWEDGSRPDYLTMRCREGGASSSGFGVAGGKHWVGMARWGAKLTIQHFGGSDV